MLNHTINFNKFTNAQLQEWGRALVVRHNKITGQDLLPPPAREYVSPFKSEIEPDDLVKGDQKLKQEGKDTKTAEDK